MLLTATDVQKKGLELLGVRQGRKSKEAWLLEFHKHYGSSPTDVADCWFDLCYWKGCSGESLLNEKEKSEKGFKRMMAAQYWLWCRPKNAHVFASRFGVCLDYARGAHLWKWIERIAALAEKKIVWDKRLDSKDAEYFAISSDGVDFKLWERQHKLYPFDAKAMSHKFKKCAAKYIIALSVYEPKCVFIEGPFRGGKPDLDMFRESGLMQKMMDNGKVCIADRGFRSAIVQEQKCFALPDFMDAGRELYNTKSRARLRQETWNGRLKHFGVLSQTFTHGFVKHGTALRAVAVLVQYQMDNGSPIYCV
jgi:DDE superfamily endonuclease